MQLFEGDCLEVMKTLPPESVDLVLCDLPYGTTSCAWDSIIPLPALWDCYRRIIKPEQGVIVLNSAQPFTTQLIGSNLKMFKYCWYWKKGRITGFQNAKKQPLRCMEDICVFGGRSYFPQDLIKIDAVKKNGRSVGGDSLRTDIDASAGKGSLRTAGKEYVQEFTNYPKNLLEFSSDSEKVHPTQKPVSLMKYLIKTYSREGGAVLDNCMGSGTTGVACVSTGRQFIGIEQDPKYFQLAKSRIEEALAEWCI